MRWILGLSATLLVAQPLAGAPSVIETRPGSAWKHPASGLSLPADIAGMKRERVTYYDDEVDMAGSYFSADGSDEVTVYLFRNVTGSVPLWFDRARFFIMNLPDKYGEVSAQGIRPVTPRGQSVASGLIESYQLSKTGRSSTLILFPVNGFYAKIRATSKTRDIASLEALALAAANSFDWSSKGPSPAAVPIADCSTPLAQRPPAKPVTMTSDERMTAALIGGATAADTGEDKAKDGVEPGPVFCREPGGGSLSYGMYRPDRRDDSYLLAIHDAGRGVSVGRNAVAEILGREMQADKDAPAGPNRYSVSYVGLARTEVFGDFETLPLPEQAVETIEKGKPLAIVTTWGKEREIQIVTD